MLFLTQKSVASVADSAAVNLKGTKTILAKDASTFFINGKPTFIRRLTKLSNLFLTNNCFSSSC